MRYRYRIPEHDVQKTADFFSGIGFSTAGNNVVINLKRDKTSVSLYRTGTVICDLYGDAYSGLVRDYFHSFPFDYREYARSELGLSLPSRWAGSDEAGKGDYFGPLVVASVCVGDASARELFLSGFTDSKRLSRSEILRLGERAFEITGRESIEAVCISPASFNNLYDKMRNMNDILAWAHQKAIAAVSSRNACAAAVIDKFSGDRGVEMIKRGLPGMKLHAITGGEREIAVATASVVASARFVTEMERISRSIGMDVPFGAGPSASSLARSIASEKGANFFRTVGKANFRL